MPAARKFRAPERSIGRLGPAGVARCLEAAADLALVLDEEGVVQDSCFRDAGLALELKDGAEWHGRALAEVLTVESRPKMRALLRAAAGEDAAPRHVNHLAARGADVAIEYAAVQTRPGGPILAFGRDLRPLSALQQRLLDAQGAMARDYTLQRQAEARFRVLFEGAPDALLLLEAATLRVLEANPVARRLAGEARRAGGWPVAELFVPADRPAVLAFLAAVRASGGAEPIAARLAGAGPEEAGTRLSASLLVEEPASVVLLRLPRADTAPEPGISELRERLLGVVERAPDGYVFTDSQGAVQAANAAFLAMVQLPAEDAARGRPLETWLGQPGVDVEVLLANLRARGAVQLFATTLRGEHAQVREVEVSAVAMNEPAPPSFGFAIRDVGRRIAAPAAPAPLPRSVEQLTELIGRVPLKDLVRDATDVIERLCIEAALELTGDNRASAAEMLGLSRQSLYVRLRRFGMGDLDDGSEGA